MDEKIKSLIKKNNAFYHRQRKFVNSAYNTLDAMTLEVSNAKSVSKTIYFECLGLFWMNWSILKTSVNGTKIPVIMTIVRKQPTYNWL